MELALVFNELSRRHQAPDKATARQWMELFASVVKKASEERIRSLRTDFEFSHMELSEGYLIEMWFNDEEVPEATRNFIHDLTTTFQLIKPFAADLSEDDEILERKKDIFVTCYDDDAEGLTFAYLMKGIGISFLSDTTWDFNLLPLVVNELPDDDSDDFDKNAVDIQHVTRLDHLTSHQDWIAERLKYSVGNGSVLWTKVKTWYPHLVFCNEAKKQIKALSGGPLLSKVVERLFELEDYCKNWNDDDGFDGSQIRNSSHESSETLAQYGKDREFLCPDGVTRLFEYHLKAKINGNPLRIHIWPDDKAEFGSASSGSRKILIGYVGRHLPTASDRT